MTSPRLIPSVDTLIQRPEITDLERRYGRQAVLWALRDAAAELRARLTSGADAQPGPADRLPSSVEDAAREVTGQARLRLAGRFTPSLRRVLNATGVVVHTNLGRAPLSDDAAARVARLATGYSNLEYDLAAGTRGRRDRHAEALLQRLTGAEAAVVVNNNAAATLLLLAALGHGREVLISRGELVEIGGGFRVPEIMAQSGAVLREVGTTNRTRAADYAAAIGERTALILRVHPSNFRIDGFTERPALEELVALGRRFDVAVAEDQGSGQLAGLDQAAPGPAVDTGSAGVASSDAAAFLPREPTVAEIVAAGVDVVCFSGDKLLGGPQAGILAGRLAAIDRIRTHPLMRALRVDKLTYAALEATLLAHASGRAREQVPVWRMLSLSREAIGSRAAAVADRLGDRPGLSTELVAGSSTIGGGSAPGSRLPTTLLLVRVEGLTASGLETRLRAADTPLVARIENERVVLDLRTVDPRDDDEVVAVLRQAASRS
jgi:L-seryl-tRNA(Ser) seleniumtransferase